jgi:HD-like signal output (HDOD) protein
MGATCGLKATPGLFTAGLLCEIGRFALCESSPEKYSKISGDLSDVELRAEEEKEFGVAHTEAGYVLAEHWGLPPELAEPIRFHLDPEQAVACPEVTAIVALAARCADAVVRGENAEPTIFAGLESSLQRLGVDADELLGVFDSLKKS